VGGGRGLLQIDLARFFGRCFTGLSLPPPPKPLSQTQRLTELIYIIKKNLKKKKEKEKKNKKK